MKLKHAKKNSGFTLVELLVVIAIIAALAAISSPIIIRQIARSRATQALNNGKDIYVGLREFAFNRAGVCPATAASSTEALAVLFTSGVVTDEKPFYVKGIDTAYIPGDEDKLLEAGENVYAYYPGRNIQKDKADSPIISTPASTAAVLYTAEFLTAPFGGQAVVINTDGSGVVYGINGTGGTGSAGPLVGEDGLDLLAPSARTPASQADSDETVVGLLPST